MTAYLKPTYKYFRIHLTAFNLVTNHVPKHNILNIFTSTRCCPGDRKAFPCESRIVDSSVLQKNKNIITMGGYSVSYIKIMYAAYNKMSYICL